MFLSTSEGESRNKFPKTGPWDVLKCHSIPLGPKEGGPRLKSCKLCPGKGAEPKGGRPESPRLAGLRPPGPP